VLTAREAAGKGAQRFGASIKWGKSVKRRLRERMEAVLSLGFGCHMILIGKIVSVLKRHAIVHAKLNQSRFLSRSGARQGSPHLQGRAKQRTGLLGVQTLDGLQRVGRRFPQVARLTTHHP
jgi:hypothetical protein